MDQKITVKNVNVLDLRKTPKETFDKIRLIKNVNILLVSRETAAYLPGIPSKNINAVVTMTADAETVTFMSPLTINAAYLSSFSSPKLLVSMGRVLVEPDVTPELIDEKIAGIALMGKLICPEPLVGPLHSKAAMLMGKTVPYPKGAILVTHSLTLDDAFLNTLDDGSYVVVIGSLRVLNDVTSSLIERKVRVLQVYGSIQCRQEHALAIKARLTDEESMTVVPAGHRVVEGNLTLDELTLQSLANERLFCVGDVIIGNDVDSRALDRAVDTIASMGAILCQARLKDVLKTKCDMLDDRVILYEGTLWYVDDDRQLFSDQFDYIDGPMTIVNRGELRISSDVAPKSILDRVAKIHNMGEIECQPEHVPAIEARLGIRDGDIVTPSRDDAKDDDEGPTLGNGNIMVL
jgi:hypothetical protein